MNKSEVMRSTQEQAVAYWINYLNQLRLDYLTAFMQQQDKNLEDALEDVGLALEQIRNLVSSNRGGTSGMHGFIAEVAEVGIGNARQNIMGNPDNYSWVNDNGPVDLIRDGIDIQQKFYQSGLSLGAIAAHLEKYPDFVNNGGKYQIPRDQYDQIKYLLSVTKEQANKMPTADGSFSLRQWKSVHEFFDNGDIHFDDIEPSALDYKQVQREQIEFTMQDETDRLKNTDRELRKHAYDHSKPTLKEGVKVTIVSAAIEGGTAFSLAMAEKKKEGKSLKSFTEDDWKDIIRATGKGTAKGGTRGASIYALTNFTATPAAVANSLVTASFGVADQAYLFKQGALGEVEFIENSEMLCLDAAVSGLSAFLGQAVIPIPVLGAVIGNAVGTTMYQIAKDSFSDREQQLIRDYLDEINSHDCGLDERYLQYRKKLNDEYTAYLEILARLYSYDIMSAFDGSVKLAKSFGIPTDEILDTKEKIQAYFLD